MEMQFDRVKLAGGLGSRAVLFPRKYIPPLHVPTASCFQPTFSIPTALLSQLETESVKAPEESDKEMVRSVICCSQCARRKRFRRFSKSARIIPGMFSGTIHPSAETTLSTSFTRGCSTVRYLYELIRGHMRVCCASTSMTHDVQSYGRLRSTITKLCAPFERRLTMEWSA